MARGPRHAGPYNRLLYKVLSVWAVEPPLVTRVQGPVIIAEGAGRGASLFVRKSVGICYRRFLEDRAIAKSVSGSSDRVLGSHA